MPSPSPASFPGEPTPAGGAVRIVQIVTTGFAAARLFRGQAGFLARSGFDVTIVSASHPDMEGFAEQEGVRVETVEMEREIAPLRDLMALWRLWRLLARLRPDAVHVGAPKAGLLGGLAAWAAGVRCRIYTLHGLRLETATGLKRRLLWAAERLACRAATRVLCVGPGVRRRAAELRLVHPEKTAVLGAGSANGVDLERFGPTAANQARADALRKEFGLAPGAPVAGFVGRLTKDKGIAELTEAFFHIRSQRMDAQLLLAGGFEEGDPLPEAVRVKLALDPGVRITGWVRDPAPYYHVLDVLALPSYREGLPTAVLEAAAAGKPAVAADATGVSDAVIDGVTGRLVPVGDSRRLAAELRELLDDEAERGRLGQAARERAVRHFDARDLARRYRAFFAEEHRSARRRALARGPLIGNAVTRRLKRMMDAGGALAGLLVCLPLMAVCAAAVRMSLGKPVLFRQQRPGLAERPFTPLKFRTMTFARGPDGALLDDSQRTTRLGRLLRALSLDELPQLWNVLRGEMSLVGPRPLLMEYLPRYSEQQRRRHNVRPGLTGLAQVEGRNAISWERRLALDAAYVTNWSLWLDLKILARTAGQILAAAAKPGKAPGSMPEFRGAGEKITANT